MGWELPLLAESVKLKAESKKVVRVEKREVGFENFSIDRLKSFRPFAFGFKLKK